MNDCNPSEFQTSTQALPQTLVAHEGRCVSEPTYPPSKYRSHLREKGRLIEAHSHSQASICLDLHPSSRCFLFYFSAGMEAPSPPRQLEYARSESVRRSHDSSDPGEGRIAPGNGNLHCCRLQQRRHSQDIRGLSLRCTTTSNPHARRYNLL